MRLCVLIPAFNEGKVIRKSILSAYRAGMEPTDVYVVNDGSTDNTADVARHYHAQVLTTPNGGKAKALHTGIDRFMLALHYTHVAILDADSTVGMTYIDEMKKAITAHLDVALFCGAPRSLPHNWLTSFRAVEYAISQGVFREAQSFMGTIFVSPGCASVYKLSTLVKLDFAGDTLVEDMDLTMQLQRQREKIFYVPTAIVYTQDPSTIQGFIGQLSRWHRGTWQVVRKHRLMRRAQPVDFEIGLMLGEGLLFSVLLLLSPFLYWWLPALTWIGFALDQFLLLTFTLLVAVRERRWDVLLAFPMFSIPRLINWVVFPWAFFAERWKQKTTWFSVVRY